ncbi:hypothetical protein SAMN05216600_1179 [Pseudomonas cuatrocienegasensis]|uniref:Cupin domain-containing protein n=1 Tax=Pseudomonas cuatrocienegasensis TaxID=543360 RepID=A0ABY1BMF6_9PSED|nr:MULTISPECIES: cupin domain-containing protein [Pseudomonas]OEC34409.1 hypothetical protein A7D25_13695 [Pseudomonas sp. 21C1]SER18758.1 hypothetical protein SAMN05216600_1179 [Pseudomonas cuatrocienegasensis]
MTTSSTHTQPTDGATLRVVTVIGADGRSGIHDNQLGPRVYYYRHIPGMATSILWATTADAVLPEGFVDPVPSLASLHPSPGGSVFMTLTLPPDALFATPGFDFAAAALEQAQQAPGLAELFEPAAPGFHTTETVDYVTVLDGEVWLETDTQEVRLGLHDSVVQNGTRHAWRNKSSKPATLSVVLVGVHRQPVTARD